MANSWIPDKETYNNIQKLTALVTFLSNTKYATIEFKEQSPKIISLIKNLNKPETFMEWNVCLDIFDREIQYNSELKGIYWRSWFISFEQNRLEIEATTHHSLEPFGHYGDDFNFYEIICFDKQYNFERIITNGLIDEFIKDFLNFENYITEKLNDVEIEIDIWKSKTQDI